eukprot:11337322-Alexandrium_andersonii.AAC.1
MISRSSPFSSASGSTGRSQLAAGTSAELGSAPLLTSSCSASASSSGISGACKPSCMISTGSTKSLPFRLMLTAGPLRLHCRWPARHAKLL